MKDIIKNSLSAAANANRNYVSNEIARKGSPAARSATYLRNQGLNWGSRQLMGMSADSEVYIIGVGGPPSVGS